MNFLRRRTFYSTLFSFLLLFSSAALSWSAELDALSRMLSNEKTRSPYVDEYIEQIKSKSNPDPELIKSLDWKWNTREELDLLAARFADFVGPDSPLKLRLDAHEYVHSKHGKGMLLLGVIYLDSPEYPDQPTLATVVRSFRRNARDSEIEVWGDGLRIDHRRVEAKNLIQPILKYLDFVYAEIHAGRERLVADWRGRFFWTMADYDFDPEYRFYDRGKFRDQLSVFHENFLEFLKLHQIPLKELVIVNKKQEKQVHSIEDFQHPRDFVQARHPHHKIQLQTLVDVETVESQSQPLEVGVAFALADYTPTVRNKEANVLSCSQLLMYRRGAMPAWRALRTLK